MSGSLSDVDTPLIERLHEVVGDDLRAVSRYHKTDYRLKYLRADVDRLYSTERIDEIFDDIVLQGLHKERIESLFVAGELECSMFKFEEALMFHFVKDHLDGLFVTLDAGANIEIGEFAAICKEHL